MGTAQVDAEKAAYSADPAVAVAELAGLLLQRELATLVSSQLDGASDKVETAVAAALAADPAPSTWGLAVKGFRLTTLEARGAAGAAAAEAARDAAAAEAKRASEAAAARVEAKREQARQDAAYAHERRAHENRAVAESIVSIAEAEAKATKIRAKATVEAIKIVAAALESDGADRIALDAVVTMQAAALGRAAPAPAAVDDEAPAPAPPPAPAATSPPPVEPDHPASYFPPPAAS